MRVYKFGGASVKNADGIKNILKIIQGDPAGSMMLVISAMGKTTNALEQILDLAMSGETWEGELNKLKDFNREIVTELFPDPAFLIEKTEAIFIELEEALGRLRQDNYDFHYDQLVSFGEYLSATILTHYLRSQGINAKFTDARQHIFTDDTYRAAKVDMLKTLESFQKMKSEEAAVYVMQGFIGMDEERNITTLGREGSDYSAAIAAYCLDAKELTIWKDVDGVYNADPKIFSNTRLIPDLSYREAVELAFYGASIIHPKTIQPLKEKAIQLRVRSFYHLDREGTIVKENVGIKKRESVIIVKRNQLLLSITPHDFSFMDAGNMSLAFKIFSKYRYQINLLQNSAISFSVCLDDNRPYFNELLTDLQRHFEVRYNTEQVLLSIRHYDTQIMDQIYAQLPIKMEQRSRSTYQIVVNKEVFQHQAVDLLNALDS